MEFVESKRFSRRRKKRLDFGAELEMHEILRQNPYKGTLEKGTGGFRKIRVATNEKGKSGSVRVIYYFLVRQDQVLLYDLFEKSEKSSLTDQEKKEMKLVASVLKSIY